MTTETEKKAGRLPPRWFISAAWLVHRALYRLTGGRFGLRPPTPDQWGMLRIHTIGRRSGAKRVAILGYYEDGPNLVTMAMNGWGDPEPAWWLNLQAQPDVTLDLVDGRREVHARAARRRGAGTPLGPLGALRRRGQPQRLGRAALPPDPGGHLRAAELSQAQPISDSVRRRCPEDPTALCASSTLSCTMSAPKMAVRSQSSATRILSLNPGSRLQ